MVYPAGGQEANLRTHAQHMALADRSNPEANAGHDYYGVHSGRPFLTKVCPNIDIVYDIVIDYMHLVCEGKEFV